MKILRDGDEHFAGRLLDCKVYVRKDLTVARASEWYYVFVGECSYLPISSLLAPKDGELLLQAAQNLTDPVELITTITNQKSGYRNIYLRMENCDETEDGVPLLYINMYDIRDMEERNIYMGRQMAKYRQFMTLNNQYYFEYALEDDEFVLYKYINETSLQLFQGTLEAFAEQMDAEYQPSPEQQEQMNTFCHYLKLGSASFELEFTMNSQGENASCRVKGGCLLKEKNFLTGIMVPSRITENEAYYLTPAARDAGTGLFNKKAITEYAVEKLQRKDGKVRWFLLFDIDDFKSINDTFGHLFGDKVIRKVADVLQINAGYRGVVGRFGGDEFFVLLEKVPDREALKSWLKTVVKEIAYAFDPKLKVMASIGISQYPVDGEDYQELFEKADKALYIAKEKGKNRHIIYDEKLHGALVKDDMQNMALAYAVSKVKRREALTELLSNIYGKGIDYISKNKKVQKRLRDLFDLDGITIYDDYGKRVVCRSGNYMHEAQDAHIGLTDEKYVALFGEESVLVETNTNRLKSQHMEAYKVAAYQEIGASIQCIGRRDGVPYALINFDVFNRNRKWSDTDIEMLGIIGSCIGNLLCQTAE